MNIRIGNLLDFSTIDWPGYRTFMLFCCGCNFHCPFCDNSLLIPMDSGREIDLRMVKKRVLANIGFLDALGFTGGEPTLQPEQIAVLCEWARARGLKTFLNTNGSNPAFIDGMLRGDLLDHVAIDVKAPLNEESYRRAAGLGNNVRRMIANIKETIKLCDRSNISVEIRTTVVPTLIFDEGSIYEIARIVKNCGTYVLQEFFPFENVPDAGLRMVKPPERELLIRLAKTALETGLKKVYIRTRGRGMERIFIDS